MARPIALSDEDLSIEDQDEMQEFNKIDGYYGRRSSDDEPKSLLDMFDDPEGGDEPELDFEDV